VQAADVSAACAARLEAALHFVATRPNSPRGARRAAGPPRDTERAAVTSRFAVVLLGAASLVPLAASADPLVVTGAQTTPSATATAANNAPGDITVNSGASIIVTSGIPVTINSNNLVTNGGTISATGTTGTAILFDGSASLTNARLVNNGTISATGAGPNNIGILIANGPVTGSIGAGGLSTISVAGDNANGLLIRTPFTGAIALAGITAPGANSVLANVAAPLNGSLILSGQNTAVGAGSAGILVSAPVSGLVSNRGAISIGTSRTVDQNNAEVAGNTGLAGVAINASVGGGFLNDRYYLASDGTYIPLATGTAASGTLITSTIVTTGAPAVVIGPGSTNPQPVTLGPVGTGDDAYGFVNRGQITTGIAKAGQTIQAVVIGGAGATTTLAGGLNNQGSGVIIAGSLDGPAIGIRALTGANIPVLQNQGAITAAATATAASGKTPAGPGGNATAILIDSGATVPLIVNTGILTSSANGTNVTAAGIVDKSGSVRTIINTGTITQTTAGTAVAIDLTANPNAVTVANSGAIGGSILFGSGRSTLAISGGSINGNVAFGAAGGAIALSGAGSFAGPYTSPVAVDATLADTSRLDLSDQATPTLASVAATGSSTLVVPFRAGAPGLTVVKNASFTGTSTIRLSLQSLAATQNFTVIQAGGGITTDHLPTLIDRSNAPFLFTQGDPVLSGNTLSVALTRLPTAQIGLAPAQAALFDLSVIGLAGSPTASALIANLPTQGAVISAYRQLTPASFGRAPIRAAESFADFGFGSAGARMEVVENQRRNQVQGAGGWAQQYGQIARSRTGLSESAFDLSSYGLTFGGDRRLFGNGVVGIGFVANWASVTQEIAPGLGAQPLFVNTQAITPYAGLNVGPAFVEVTGLAGTAQYRARRSLVIGGSSSPFNASWSGLTYGGAALIGAHLNVGRLKISPQNTISYLAVQQDGYTISGAGAFNLQVSSQTETVVTDTAQLRLSYDLKRGATGLIRIEANGGYALNLDPKPTTTTVRFLTGAASSAALIGDKPKSSGWQYGGALSYLQPGFAARFNYDRRDTSNYNAQNFVATLGLDF